MPEGEKIELANEKEIKIVKLNEEQLKELISEAREELTEIVVTAGGYVSADFIKGETEVDHVVKKEVEGEMVVQKDPITKKPKTEKVTVPVLLPYPFK